MVFMLGSNGEVTSRALKERARFGCRASVVKARSVSIANDLRRSVASLIGAET